MTIKTLTQNLRPKLALVYSLLISILFILLYLYPKAALDTSIFVLNGILHITPIVIPGILLTGWIVASGASDRIANIFKRRILQAVLAAALVGAFIPVCGITVLPLMAGLLAAGVPLAPVMAFWLASPITSPPMLAVTVATLGWEYAIGKSLAAIGLGLMGGAVTASISQREWVKNALRNNNIVGNLGTCCGNENTTFKAKIWKDSERRKRFRKEIWWITRLMLIVLIPAFAAEYLMNVWLEPTAIAAYVGSQNSFAIPFAVFFGGPAYIDGYAALPLTRGLIDHGMSPGAAMAFLISGGVVSIWGAMAIFPVLKLKPFLLYLALALSGSMISGYIFEFFY